MDVDSSETANAGTGIKFDSQSTESNVSPTAVDGSINDDRQETFESGGVKTTNTADGNGQKSAVNDEVSSVAIKSPPNSELQFRNDNSSAISKTIKQPGNIPVATESDSFEVEIKQEDPCLSLSTPLPPHAISKIQVCIQKYYSHTCTFQHLSVVLRSKAEFRNKKPSMARTAYADLLLLSKKNYKPISRENSR